MLLDRDEFRNLTGANDLWMTACERAARLVYAAADLRATETGLITRAAVARPGYDKMLLECCSGVAAENGAKDLQIFGTSIRPRAWGPMRGARRRGSQVARQLKREQNLNDEHLRDLFGEIRRVFLLSAITA